MKRREFIVGLGAAAWPLVATGQQTALPVVGWLHGQSPESVQDYIPAFQRGLADAGFIVGYDVVVEHRWAEGHVDRYDPLAAELVRRQVAAIVADTTVFAQAAKAATQTIPVVFVAGGDPIEFGLVASFNRPGGNLTGVVTLGPDLTAKRLDLLHKLVPAARTIAMLVGLTAGAPQYAAADTKGLQSAAGVLGVRALVLNIAIESPQRDVATAFTKLIEQQAGAILVSSNSVVMQPARDQIILLAARNGIPTMFVDRRSVAAGALSSYGPDLIGAQYQAGLYAGQILKGEKPADMPVVRPTKLELALNLKTAKALGLEIPPGILAIADEVIE